MSIDPMESALSTTTIGQAGAGDIATDPGQASAKSRAEDGVQSVAAASLPSPSMETTMDDPEYHKALLSVYHDGQGAIINGYY